MTTPSGGTGSPFLGTTALEEFWDPSRPMAFLGPWCCRYTRRGAWEPLAAPVMRPPLLSLAELNATHDYLRGLYERILPLLAEAFNALHGTRHGLRYWRIVAGTFLKEYLPVACDRYACVERALETWPDLVTAGLDEAAFTVPRHSGEFVFLVGEDRWNLQIYTRILQLLGRDPPRRQLAAPAASPASAAPRPSGFIRGLARRIERLMARRAQLVMWRSYFSVGAELRLGLASGARAWPIRLAIGCPPLDMPVDPVARARIAALDLGSTPFERMLAPLLAADLPKSLVEGYAAVGQCAEREFPPRPRAILSANGWYHDETFKQWSAAQAARGALLLGTSHSALQVRAHGFPEDLELPIVDRYYSWGWTLPPPPQVVPMPASKMSTRKRLGPSNLRNGILYVATGLPRYLRFTTYAVHHLVEYLAWQERFLGALKPHLRKHLLARLYHIDFGWDVEARWHDFAPEVRIDHWEQPFAKRLESCRLYVCDHLSTTFAEALAADKPTVLFWNTAAMEFTAEAAPLFERLQQARVFHNTPESAARTVAEVYDDVEGWWRSDAVQSARAALCERFVRTAPDAVSQWGRELRRVLRLQPAGQG